MIGEVGAKASMSPRLWTLATGIGLFLITGCAAVYPEMKTAIREPEPGAELEPEPANDLYYLFFEGASIPPKTQGGQKWPGGAPDPFAKLIVNDVEILETPVESRTRAPTWAKQDKKNYRIQSDSMIYVEVWDDNTMTNHPICRARVRDIEAIRDGGNNEIWCDSGARVRLHVEHARGLLGLGLYYETRGADGVRVTRVLQGSPAERAGLGPGDRILAIQGEKVSSMDALKVRSMMNLHSRAGLELDVWFQGGKRHLISLKEGAIYPLSGDGLELPQ